MEGAYYLCSFLLGTCLEVPIKTHPKKKKTCLEVLYSIANPMFFFLVLSFGIVTNSFRCTSTDAWFVAIPDNITTNYCIAINISFLLTS